jgi:hypothetical protein
MFAKVKASRTSLIKRLTMFFFLFFENVFGKQSLLDYLSDIRVFNGEVNSK